MSSEDKLQDILSRAKMSEELRIEHKIVIDEIVRAAVNEEMIRNNRENLDSNKKRKVRISAQPPTTMEDFIEKNNVVLEPITSSRTSRTRKSGEVKFSLINDLSKMSPIDRIKAIQIMHSEVPRDSDGAPIPTQLQQDSQNLYFRSIKPIMACLAKCFEGGSDAFLSKYPKCAYSRFKCTCDRPE